MVNLVQGGINVPVVNVSAVVTVAGNGHAANAVKAGDPVLIGNIPGVAFNDYGLNGDTLTDVNTACIARLSVKGIGASGNAAINVNDVLYMQTDGTIDKNSGGSGAVKFGTAWGSDDSASAVGVVTRTGQVVASGNAGTVIQVWVGKIN